MATMKAIRINKFGGPEMLALESVTKPEPAAGEVLVRVCAASINPMDWKLREGLFKDIKPPFTPGADFSGVIEDVGKGVTDYVKWDEVYGCVTGAVGADAEYAIALATAIASKPRSLDHVQAASVPLAAMTAWQALFEYGKLAEGQTALILGASGGVGSFAVQLAKAAGARVFGTASAGNVEYVRALGADQVIDYKAQRFEAYARNVDLCVDLVGGDFGNRAFLAVKRGGMLVSAVQTPDQNHAAAKGITAKMMVMRPKSENLREIARKIDNGEVRVQVAAVFPLERAAEAEELNRSHEVEGKIVLKVEEAPELPDPQEDPPYEFPDDFPES